MDKTEKETNDGIILVNDRVASALFAAGEMVGVASRLDADILEEYLDKRDPGDGFRYTDLCRAAIVFRRTAFT